MKKVLIVLAVVLIPSICFSAPFLICDPYPITVKQPTFFKVSLNGGAKFNSPVQAVTGGVRLHQDVGTAPVGLNTWTVQACITDDWATEVCSAETPFSSRRLGPDDAPANALNLSLSPQ